MDCEDNLEDDELLDLILKYADTHPNFDREFIDSVDEAFEKYDSLTEHQYEACINIARAFRLGPFEKRSPSSRKTGFVDSSSNYWSE